MSGISPKDDMPLAQLQGLVSLLHHGLQVVGTPQKSSLIPSDVSILHPRLMGANYPPLYLWTLLTFQEPGHGHFQEWNGNGGIIAFNVAWADLESYLNTVTSAWVTPSGTCGGMKQSLFSCMVVTFGVQGETACQSHEVIAGQMRGPISEAGITLGL